jgi:AcrR family transcriptional regulator
MPTSKTRMSRGRRRPVAGRGEILAAARGIGVRQGWKAVTIRSVAQELGYASPLLYEHFRDKEELLTQIAVEAIAMLETRLTENLPADRDEAVLIMIERYWTFMLEHTQLYRLMNGMEGVPIDKDAVGQSAQSLCRMIGVTVQPLVGERSTLADGQTLADELWALLHGMAALYLDRSAPFDLARVTKAALRMIGGARLNVRASANGNADSLNRAHQD